MDYKVASMADESPEGGGSHMERREVLIGILKEISLRGAKIWSLGVA